MSLTEAQVTTFFEPLIHGDISAFYDKMTDDCVVVVSSPVKDINKFGGTFNNKQDQFANWEPFHKCLAGPPVFTVTSVLVSGSKAVAEVIFKGVTKKDEKAVEVHDAWVMDFQGDKVVKCNVYTDSALLNDIVEKNL